MRSGQIVVGKPETIGKTDGIDIFSPDKTGKGFDPEMQVGTDIRQIF